MARDHAFPPVEPESAKILILGSLPGQRSLELQQYYGHPRNLFWPIIEELLPIAHGQTYKSRIESLKTNDIMLWDVCKSAFRPGSLDSSIKKEEPNPIPELIESHPELRLIVFNGKKAAQLFEKYFSQLDIAKMTMLSTSPANASFSVEDKLISWARMMEYLD